ncbi:hypothetical protein HLB23_28700 [Nocardia uniformis]|uniref:Uncharacterized protein n=1 Tax=Nocardia uniformis TaxID=53432 RepID=A0A849CCJ5_9NOCA|nr:hypothetical protein [Nocardia uniformis]NNH73787.1 hypothetical protein [Nocardia uniformis]
MSLPSFDEETYENSSDHGTCYTIESTDEVPVSGRVFVDMAEHTVLGDDGQERRPKIVFRFFGLFVNGRWLGAPVSTAAFYPSWSDHRPGISMLSLGEPGHLVIEVGRLLTNQPPHVQQAVDTVLAALSHRFLTDLRVAQYQQARAAQRCERASRAQELAEMRKDIARLRYRQARIAADGADALLTAVRHKTGS